MPTHNKLKIFFMLLTVVIYTIMIVMNAGAGSGAFRGVFHTTVGNISRHHDTDFTPASWAFFIWNLIFLWQYAWLVYALSGLCRRNELGWVYMLPDVLPLPFYWIWMLNNALNIGWLFLWDSLLFSPALLVLGLLTLTNYAALFISHRALFPHTAWFQKHSKADLWLIRILVQNGIALYATWTTIATLLNFTVVLIYNGHVSNETATIVSLCILLCEVAVWFYLENFLFDKYVRYNLIVYPVVVLALCATLQKNSIDFSPKASNIITVVLLVVTCVIFSIRVGLVTWRHRKENLDKLLPQTATL
ncbi:uncharacterized protein LOC103279469 [Anolis carolinensis]|uniref:uncharacterized protein LOC103279469 n=1 Tax=Anolis carolinensis TaxID=28377 RepID=UPI000462C518|nr:PREDICTED: uncharacterized protein LOC103279469 [Anolis carolinensis]|eukprot:XP_008112923.1 PREDICTED: uncharacterized protein LOC103279469 [Anolis carolinensis]